MFFMIWLLEIRTKLLREEHLGEYIKEMLRDHYEMMVIVKTNKTKFKASTLYLPTMNSLLASNRSCEADKLTQTLLDKAIKFQ